MDVDSAAQSQLLDNALFTLTSYSDWEEPRLRRFMRDVHRVGAGGKGFLARLFSVQGAQSTVSADSALRALAELPIEERRVLVLHYYCDWPQKLVQDELTLLPGDFRSAVESGLRRIAMAADDAGC